MIYFNYKVVKNKSVVTLYYTLNLFVMVARNIYNNIIRIPAIDHLRMTKCGKT